MKHLTTFSKLLLLPFLLIFTVADSLLTKLGKEITLSYDEYLLVPYRVGSTGYLITGYKNQ